MYSQAADTPLTDVRVIWRDDVDPHGTAPLWASVHVVPSSPRQARPGGQEQLIIEIGGPPRQAAHAPKARTTRRRLM